MLRILADNHDFSVSFDHFALIADFFNGWFNLHFYTIPFLFGTPCDPAFAQVVNRNLDCHLITRQNPDIVHSEFPGNVRGHDMTVGKLHFEGGVRQCFQNHAFKFHYIVF